MIMNAYLGKVERFDLNEAQTAENEWKRLIPDIPFFYDPRMSRVNESVTVDWYRLTKYLYDYCEDYIKTPDQIFYTERYGEEAWLLIQKLL